MSSGGHLVQGTLQIQLCASHLETFTFGKEQRDFPRSATNPLLPPSTSISEQDTITPISALPSVPTPYRAKQPRTTKPLEQPLADTERAHIRRRGRAVS